MVWDFAEANPFCSATSSLESMFDWIVKVIDNETANQTLGSAEAFSATDHVLPNDACDLLFTDPPYYAAVPYADLSDLFYIWLRRCLKETHPALFSEALSPKEDELVSLSHRAAMYRPCARRTRSPTGSAQHADSELVASVHRVEHQADPGRLLRVSAVPASAECGGHKRHCRARCCQRHAGVRRQRR
jgi:adenine-specific DNA methylase